MPDIQIFYCCVCPKCESDEEEHQIILPRRVDGLGNYSRLKSPLGVYEYGGPYVPAKKAWPAKFMCCFCQVCSPQQEPKLKTVDRDDRLHRFVDGRQFFRIEVASADEKFYTAEREIIYTMARFNQRERLADIVERSCWYPELAPERVTVCPFPFDKFFVNDSAA